MTHDPLCPAPLEAGLPDPTGLAEVAACRCDLIARVRADERKQYATYSNARNTGRRDGYVAALRDAVEAVKASDPECSGLCDCEAGHVAAIGALGGESRG